MTSEEKQKWIYGELGLGCWHEWNDYSYECEHCGSIITKHKNIDLTTWPGFGLAFPAMQKHERWGEFERKVLKAEYYINDREYDGFTGFVMGWEYLINPPRFLRALCEFFGLEVTK